MSLPPELRVLCNQLSTTPTTDLPRLTPVLLRNILRCQVVLSSSAANAAKSDSSTASVLVHKLKTQLSALLTGRTPEGRFTAVVLIKAVVEVGGWEVLRGAESWVRGMISVLGKPDSGATKELCIIALTKVYCMTHQYQTLLREFTTPTLPGFITACLNLVSPKSATKTAGAAEALMENVFSSFALLLPRHTTLFRPFVAQIRTSTRRYLASTFMDGSLVSSSLVQAARHLFVLLHQTVAKGGGGEEWAKSFRDLINGIHVTADNVFRGVVEEWESSAGYTPQSIDINHELAGGGQSAEDLPVWEGIHAGMERLTGLLELLSVYFRVETSTPVAVPLGSVVDLIVRILSVANPTPSDLPASKGGPRVNPAIDRDEKDALWSGIPQIYVAALEVIESLVDRFGDASLPLSQGLVMQIGWIYMYGRHASQFRQVTYTVITKLLPYTGQNLAKNQVSKLYGIIRDCCDDVHGSHEAHLGGISSERAGGNAHGSNQNADTFLRKSTDTFDSQTLIEPRLVEAASKLLPLIFSHLPQHHLDITIRALVERTVILNHNKSGMLSSVLNPFIGRSGGPLPSIVPHLSRAFPHDAMVEVLLRPRMPLVSSSSIAIINDTYHNEALEDEDMDRIAEISAPEVPERSAFNIAPIPAPTVPSDHQLPGSTGTKSTSAVWPLSDPGINRADPERTDDVEPRLPSFPVPVATQTIQTITVSAPIQDTVMEEGNEEDSSDNESVHLTMQLDSDSEAE